MQCGSSFAGSILQCDAIPLFVVRLLNINDTNDAADYYFVMCSDKNSNKMVNNNIIKRAITISFTPESILNGIMRYFFFCDEFGVLISANPFYAGYEMITVAVKHKNSFS